MAADSFALKGNIIFALDKDTLVTYADSFLVCREGKVEGIYDELPENLQNIEIRDYSDCIIIPGLIDLHIHASQFAFRGVGLDMELLQWLENYTFKEEMLYKDLDYARKAYEAFIKDLVKGGTTRAVIYSTVHRPASKMLMEMLAETNLVTYVGKVNMDRNCPEGLCEITEDSLVETEKWLVESLNRYDNVKPIITPRFVPSCSGALLAGLGQLAAKYNVPVQSHLAENRMEVFWVMQLHPEVKSYSHLYRKYGLLGQTPTIMAHCIYCTESEMALLAENKVFVAHCPGSNTNLASGVAPVRKMLNYGIPVGLGTDIAGGFSTSIFRAMADAIQVSKLRYALLEEENSILNVTEAFYMGTKGGGAFFGKVGSFEKGYCFDALVIDDGSLGTRERMTLPQRLERIIYLADERNIKAKYTDGKPVL